jgi:hypothetical protein
MTISDIHADVHLEWPQKLKLIDVWQNQVVEAPAKCTYLALSYVFGIVHVEVQISEPLEREVCLQQFAMRPPHAKTWGCNTSGLASYALIKEMPTSYNCRSTRCILYIGMLNAL